MMRLVFTLALFPLACQASLRTTPVAHAEKTASQHVQFTAAQQKQMHWGCVNACELSPGGSKCVTDCEAAMYQCIDHTGPNETPKHTDTCQAEVLKKIQEMETPKKEVKEEKNLEKKEDNKKDVKKVAKEDTKKGKAFLQVARNIDDDNAEASEMARLEAQSDKDMGEDDDQTSKSEDSSDNEEESFVQVKRNIDDDNAEAAEMARLEAQSDKDMGEDDDETSKSDDSSDNEEESFVQLKRNIDDDNAEAAEMARLEAQSDRDMGEDDDETSKSDDTSDNEEESFVQAKRNIDASVNVTSETANLTSVFASLSLEIQPAGQCSLMGGMVLPKVSARCCFSIQVATQRGLAEYDMAEPCKGAWRCQADGVTPEPAFEEQARHEVCSESTCIAGVQTAMKANWKTAKAAKYMDALCDARTVSIAEGTEAGLIRASAEGMEAIRRRRKKKGKEGKKKRVAQCFPGEAVVQVQGRGLIPIASVRIGDLVLVAKPEFGASLEYEALVDWLHVAKGVESSFVTIHHEQGVFRASPGHLVFAASGNLGYDDMPASFLREGDVLFAIKDNNLGPSKILAIEYDSVSLGMYAPLTHTGTIVVDGVLASNYATPSLEVRLPHWLAHAGFWPVRMFHSLGFASLFSAAKPMFFGDSELKGPEPETFDTMHPYCSFLYKGLNAHKLLQTV